MDLNMIDFHYSLNADNTIQLYLKTKATEIGTLNRMVSVIYSLDWDILEGEIRTIVENNTSYSYDFFLIQTETKKPIEKAMELGILMESVFSQKTSLNEILKTQNKKLQVKKFFENRAELIFQDEVDKNVTTFYIEANSAKGLLYHITRVLMNHRINIIEGIIKTDRPTNLAMDTFYLQDETGSMFGNTEKALQLKEDLLKPF